jgi:hypothetical protein
MEPLLDGIGGGGAPRPGIPGDTEGELRGMGGGIDGAGTLPVALGMPPTPGGGGVVPVPIFWRRDFRSIFGFLSSAIVSA